MVGLGAAQEQRRQLAQAALVDQVDAGATAQQLRQRMRLAAFDLVAVDDFDRGERLVDGDRGAGAGDDDAVEVGRVAGLRECDAMAGTARAPW